MYLQFGIFLIFFYDAKSGVSKHSFFKYGPGLDKEMNRTDNSSEMSFTTPFNLWGEQWNYATVRGDGKVQLRANRHVQVDTWNYVVAKAHIVAFSGGDLDQDYTVYYRQSHSLKDMQKANNEINSVFKTMKDVDLHWAIIVTWDSGPHQTNFDLNRTTLQLVLATDGQQSFALFYYHDITYSSGKKLAWYPGFERREDSNTRQILDQSIADDLNQLQYGSNAGVPGKWIFRVDKFRIYGPFDTTTVKPTSKSTTTTRMPPTAPTTQPETCLDRPVIENGECEQKPYKVGENASCKCHPNVHRVNPEASVRCVLTDDGKYIWREEMPFCEPNGAVTIQQLSIFTFCFIVFIKYYVLYLNDLI
ncbi:nidogen-like domain-containing protein [Ditylenchus destructor]|nr:nidogen-like domain-containing protein [Ditylenchus destructor]